MDREHEIGLVLGGGGAKGAYQVGALKALAEHGLLKNVTAISGTSAGGLNAAMLLGLDGTDIESNVEKMEWIWKKFDIGDFAGVSKNKNIDKIIDTIRRAYEFVNDIPINLLSGGVLNQKVIKTLINENIDLSRLCRNDVDLYITTCKQKLSPDSQYVPNFISDEFTPYDLQNILLATSAIPGLYPAVSIKGENYIDGGISDNEILEMGISNVPCKILADKGYKNIIIIHFNNDISFNQKEYLKGCTIIEITPDDIKKTDTFNFDKDWIGDGEKDAKKQLDKYSDAIKKIKEKVVQKMNRKDYRWDKSKPISKFMQLVDAMTNDREEIIVTGALAGIIKGFIATENVYEIFYKVIALHPLIFFSGTGVVQIVSLEKFKKYVIKYNFFEYSKNKIAFYLKNKKH